MRDVLLKGFLRAEEHAPKLAVVVNVAGRPRVFPDVLRSLGRQSFVCEHPACVEVLLVQDGPEGRSGATFLRRWLSSPVKPKSGDFVLVLIEKTEDEEPRGMSASGTRLPEQK